MALGSSGVAALLLLLGAGSSAPLCFDGAAGRSHVDRFAVILVLSGAGCWAIERVLTACAGAEAVQQCRDAANCMYDKHRGYSRLKPPEEQL